MTICVDDRDTCCPSAADGHGANETKRRPTVEFRDLPDALAENLVELFKLLADDTRLRILFLLQHKRELNVRALCGLLKQSQPAVSHHLALLRSAGLIEMRRDGKHNFYRLLSRRFDQLLGMVFPVASGGQPQIHFQTGVLSYTPVDQSA